MSNSVTLAPSHALLFISDQSGGDIPEFTADAPIMSTETGILVHCLPDMDGDTTVTLGKAENVGQVGPPVFDGIIKLPTKNLMVATVEDDGILFDTVPTVETRIRIWTNRALDPDDIVIGWGEGDVAAA
jgi:hypothetical protein